MYYFKALIVVIVGGFLGKLIVGFFLNYFLKPQEREDPNPENGLGYIGSLIGGIIAWWIFMT